MADHIERTNDRPFQTHCYAVLTEKSVGAASIRAMWCATYGTCVYWNTDMEPEKPWEHQPGYVYKPVAQDRIRDVVKNW